MINEKIGKKKVLEISIVINTIGENILNKVLESIINNSVNVKEIIISIPENKNFSISKELINENNIKIIKTKFNNQIIQRIAGFKIASSKYIIQLDSDVILDKFCIENLHTSILNITEKASVGALIFNENEGKKTIKHGFFYIIVKLIRNIILNNQIDIDSWSITKAGTGFGFEKKNISESLINVDWLAGGCIIHEKHNLILDNYLPYDGKSYCEDLIHSFLLKKKGIKLYLNNRAKCLHEDSFNIYKLSFIDFFDYFVNEYKNRKYFVKLAQLNIINFNLWSFAILTKYLIYKFLKLLKFNI